jgi:hypothetical protein
VSDSDAQAYIEAVESEDNQQLEIGVSMAINNFIIGCKSDGIWDAIKACCILAGARTLEGALVPLKGEAPTNNNFVEGDYNRETGLIGNGSTKYLNANRANNADPEDSNHNAVFCSVLPTAGRLMNSANQSGDLGANTIAKGSSGNTWNVRNRWDGSVGADENKGSAVANTFVGINRNSPSSYILRSAGSNTTITRDSGAPTSASIFVFQGDSNYTDARLSFYSIGESLDLALLDNRVSTLMTDIGAAIP